jgi:hypothetical protein
MMTDLIERLLKHAPEEIATAYVRFKNDEMLTLIEKEMLLDWLGRIVHIIQLLSTTDRFEDIVLDYKKLKNG